MINLLLLLLLLGDCQLAIGVVSYRKCCPEEQLFVSYGLCSMSDVPRDPPNLTWIPDNNNRDFCMGKRNKAVIIPQSFYKLIENGRMYENYLDGSIVGNEDFCLEFTNSTGDELTAVVCFMDDNKKKIIYGMLISIPFLFVTMLVYALLPDSKLHQKALMFYVLSLLMAYIFLVTINLSTILEGLSCTLMGYFTQYAFAASFFWMNVICFDIWYTFSGGRGFVGSKKSSERRKLILYSLYAFGMPLLYSIFTALMQEYLPKDSKHNPQIGTQKCFLSDGWPSFWYMYLVASLLVITNLVLFLVTAFKIRNIQKETSVLKHTDSKRHAMEKDKQKFSLYGKLLLAMGINWSMEILSWAVNLQTGQQIAYIWWVTDFFNAMYGVFIFLMFVAKKKTWHLLQKRYYTFIGRPHMAQTVTSSHTRTSNFSSTNYSTADTALSADRTATNGQQHPPEEIALQRVP